MTIEGIWSQRNMKHDLVLLAYFSPQLPDYTPLDLAYFIAAYQTGDEKSIDFKIQALCYPDRSNQDEDTDGVDEFIRRDVEALASSNAKAAVIFCENLLWSKVYALGRAIKVARALRRVRPDLVIGFQSFKISEAEREFVLAESICDFVFRGEFDASLKRMNEVLRGDSVSGVWQRRVPPVGQNHTDVIPMSRSQGNRQNSLDVHPSPYLNGLLDQFIFEKQVEKRGIFRAFLTSSRGCCFGCFYCYRSVKYDKVRYFSIERFYDEMEYLYSKFRVRLFFVLDDAFLYSKNRLKLFAREFRARLASCPGLSVVRLFVMARPESIDEEVVHLMSRINVVWVQVGLQTVNPEIQHYMNRAVSIEHFRAISSWMGKHRIKLHLDIVLGLPGDTVSWFKESMRYAIQLKPYSLQVKQMYLNPDTLFSLKRDDYGIEVENSLPDFDAPLVLQANGVNDEYFTETDMFLRSCVEQNPNVLWKCLSKRFRYVSPQWYR